MRTPVLSAASLALGALAAGLLLGRSDAPAAAAPGDQRIAVVDIAELLKTAPGKAAIEDAYKQRKDKTNAWGKSESDRIKQMQSQLELLPRTDPTRAAKEKELDRTMMEFKFEGEYATRQNEVQYTDDMEGVYELIKSAIRDVATRQGFSIVLTKNDERVDAARYTDFVSNVMVRPVVFYERSFDITQAVKDQLATVARPPSPPPGAPPPPPSTVPPSGPVSPPSVPPAMR